jgi:hypothetical protein
MSEKMEDSLSEEARNLYSEGLARARHLVGRSVRRGISPEKVARTVARALTAPRPKIRYPVGVDARFGVFFSCLLPDRFFDWLTSVRFASVPKRKI